MAQTHKEIYPVQYSQLLRQVSNTLLPTAQGFLNIFEYGNTIEKLKKTMGFSPEKNCIHTIFTYKITHDSEKNHSTTKIHIHIRVLI